MSKINDGGPAFPTIETDNADAASYMRDPGMSLRDWFAGQALAGRWLLTNPNEKDRKNQSVEVNNFMDARCAAAWSYRIADAMLAAREVGR